MVPKFGTSGLRGLVSELTDGLTAGYVNAFLKSVPHRGVLFIGRDLRPSSLRLAEAVAAAAENLGLDVVNCGALPTPALALAAMSAGAPAVMVTGSHIPADRNGLKFYKADGEITKADEAAILASYDGEAVLPSAQLGAAPDALQSYARRYLGYFAAGALSGLRVGLWQHSSVARDLLDRVLIALGAETVPLGRSEEFVPVDTEAVSDETRALLASWAHEHRLHAIVSTDGDADRPLVADAEGRVVPGDVLGLLTAWALGAGTVVTPLSSNTVIEASGAFAQVIRTRIGSPYVIEAMEVARRDPAARVVGFEANGGFLLGFEASGSGDSVAPLMTRDAFLPILVPLAETAARGKPLSALVAALPNRHTASDRLQNTPSERSSDLVARLAADAEERARFFAGLGPETALDLTDGLRVTFTSGAIAHLRPSGNAPELRAYAEASSESNAAALVRQLLSRARDALT
ncbi:Phosphoglucosamine mutase [Defluviimonas aquaemixtae]|uniref:Phosphoglucosamine mutase n=1 Tax=Albidovulum aquaemixtae TaxID=1542388 RepID=A0A2R8B606_9RHOB|nr:phosphomannomutase [Defluviimonas aquaemixtae]SPH18037.1 Phosphoglucosamine mutase [Defluviimonas aquaemixtae]